MCCKQQIYVRLTSQLNPLAATFTKNTGGAGSSLIFRCSNVSYARLRPISFPFTFLRTLLRFFALVQNSTLFFSIDSALFAENTRGGGYALSLLSKPLPVRKACIGRTIGAESSFREAVPGHSSVVSEYVYYVGGCDG